MFWRGQAGGEEQRKRSVCLVVVGIQAGALLFSVSAKSSLMKGHLSKGLKEAWVGTRRRPVGWSRASSLCKDPEAG